jgi:hypothetical protein
MDLNRLKRFDKAKHDQLAGLLEWCQLMGLSGKDLVSLGGHIARSEARSQAVANRSAVDAMGCEPIGKDSSIDARWKLQSHGVTYWFEIDGYGDHVKVINAKTKESRRLRFDLYGPELGRLHWRKRYFYAVMTAVRVGEIQLGF